MSYLEQLKKRNELIEQADELMQEYMEIAYKLYKKITGEYSQVIHIEVEEDGIHYHYYNDGYDYESGQGNLIIKIEEIEKLHIENKYNL